MMEAGAGFQSFVAVGLQEMDAVALTNRIDTKFVFPLSRLNDVLNGMETGYSVLEIDGVRMHPYDTVYFDDSDLGLYLAHHNGRANRFKLRLRRYGNSDVAFMEVKRKTNTGRTIKARKRTSLPQRLLTDEQRLFFNQHTGADGDTWRFSMQVRFSRVTLVSFNPPERVTLDFSLEARDEAGARQFPGLVIAEVKQGGKANSAFISRMHELRIRPFSVSKYCLGISFLREHIKKNNFLPQHRMLKALSLKSSHGTL
ncbi:MAG: polyphosphate polymerase domain-containing protein [Bacteroidota bacterium]